MAQRNYADWLAAFVDHASIGEAPEHVLWWVGVSTIAGALRRKVWIDEVFFQWTPNFYIVVVAPPGVVAKSTTANIGFNLLDEAAVGAHFGPDITSWQALIQEMASVGELFDWKGGQYPMHAITCAIDEFGTFLDPTNREQVDSLIRLYDGKTSTRAFRKITKTQGSETMHGPWINLFGCTTPSWLQSHFPPYFVGGGFLSRVIFLHADRKRQRTAYLSQAVKGRPSHAIQRQRLIVDLQQIANYAGPMEITPAAYAWGERHYNFHWDRFEGATDDLQGYPARKQTHMHKLAMVISAARGDFPRLDASHLEEADRRLTAVEPGIARVLAAVGAAETPKASIELVEAVRDAGGFALRREVFGKYFFRRLSNRDFDEAVRGAIAAGQITIAASPAGAILKLRETEVDQSHQHESGGGDGVRADVAGGAPANAGAHLVAGDGLGGPRDGLDPAPLRRGGASVAAADGKGG